ncbi:MULTISPECIES: hypothetical protein [Pseudomonas]|jgi:hypothetical protein|uniref:Uncharacterized protein n=1 Tax=Pseudomonas beijingensis TaxID=2954101 RepID=A0ABY9F924_9PSED|nr:MULTISPECIES: hypothetical protein [unclassified Pseudomonas]WLG99342.1 hypothetical protein PSH92_18380 [Pseudomonas sp. FP2034]WLH44472.1 hypothetical protein PSH83_19040 [Pseudomonas sp. FP2262]WLI44426.1 hypothetical protein PSH84_23220 [Pseudomonas sp. FP830]
MNYLNSYDPSEILNSTILSLAPNNVIIQERNTVFFGGPKSSNPSPAIHSGGYPFTSLGQLGGFYLSSSRQESVAINQLQNRHCVPYNPHAQYASWRTDQLVLLDTDDVQQIKNALNADAYFTSGSSIQPNFNFSNPVSKSAGDYIAKNLHLLGPNHPNIKQCVHALSKDPAAYSEVSGWLKFRKNDVKSGNRLNNHYSNLRDSNAKHYASENRGEYGAAKLMVTVMGTHYQLKIGKASSGRTNGIDQIWVKRNLRTGAVEEYLIVECKGSVDAHLGDASYGRQMSTRWVFYCLLGLLGSNGNLASTSTSDVYAKKALVNKILLALINPGIPVRGMIVQPMRKSKTDPDSIDVYELGTYSLINEFNAAWQECYGTSSSAPTQQVVTGFRL